MKRIGNFTISFANPPSIASYASVAGKKEGEGPLRDYFDKVNEDTTFGEKSWEKAESRMQKDALHLALDKGKFSASDIDCMVAGDLLNQCVGSSYGLREFEIPFLGVFGACSTMVESLIIGSTLIDGDFCKRVAAVTSSHFCSAERQFRYPLEYGGQRPPTSQWTVTGCGATILEGQGQGPFITQATIGKIVDMGITDANNMGAAMAPAAFTTLADYFTDTGRTPADFDMILTGDLGLLGRGIVIDFFEDEGIDLTKNYNDCGCMIYDIEGQDAHCGASGCGCCASVLNGYVLEQMKQKRWNRVLLVATGALMSPTLVTQGESIPSIAHAIVLENPPQPPAGG
jgi:stage V sporulation protein AD